MCRILDVKGEQLNADLNSARWLAEVVQNELNAMLKALQNERMTHAITRSELADVKSSHSRALMEIESSQQRLAAYAEELAKFRDLARGTAALQAEKDEVLREAELLQMQLQEAHDEVAVLDGKLEEAFDTKVQLESDLVNVTGDLGVLQEKLKIEMTAEDALNQELEKVNTNVLVLQEKLDAMFTQSSILQSTIECTKQDAINIQNLLARACLNTCTMYDLILNTDTVNSGTCGLRVKDHAADASPGQDRIEYIVAAVELFSMHRVEVGDALLEINGRALGEMSLSEVKELLCGKIGSEAILLVRSKRLQKEVTVTLTRIPDTPQLNDFFERLHDARDGIEKLQSGLANEHAEIESLNKMLADAHEAQKLERSCMEENLGKLVEEKEALLKQQEALTEQVEAAMTHHRDLQARAQEVAKEHLDYKCAHQQEQLAVTQKCSELYAQYNEGMDKVERIVAVALDQVAKLLKERNYLFSKCSGEMEEIDALSKTIAELAANHTEETVKLETTVNSVMKQTTALFQERNYLRRKCGDELGEIHELSRVIKNLASQNSQGMEKVEGIVANVIDQTYRLFGERNALRLKCSGEMQEINELSENIEHLARDNTHSVKQVEEIVEA